MDSRGNNNQFRSVALIQRRDLARFNSAVSAELSDEATPPTERRRTPLRDAVPVERDESVWRRETDRGERQVRGRGRRSFGRTPLYDGDRELSDDPPREHVSAYPGESSVVGVSRRGERGLWVDDGMDEETEREERASSRSRRDERRQRDERPAREEHAPKRRSRFRLIMGKSREQYDSDYDDEYADYDNYPDAEDDYDNRDAARASRRNAYAEPDEYDGYDDYDDYDEEEEDDWGDAGYDSYDEYDDYVEGEADWDDTEYDSDDEPYESDIDLTIHHHRRRNRFDDAPQADPGRDPYIYDYNGRQRGLADPQGRRSRSRPRVGRIRAIPTAIASSVVGIASHISRGGVMFVLIVTLTAVMLFAPLRDLYIANRRLDTLQATYDALLAENDTIRTELESLQSREGIENEARARGYVEPGETKVVVNGLPEDERDPAADAVHDIELPDDRPWYVRTLDAVFGYEPEA